MLGVRRKTVNRGGLADLVLVLSAGSGAQGQGSAGQGQSRPNPNFKSSAGARRGNDVGTPKMPYQTTHDRVLLKHPKVGKTLNILRCRAFISLKLIYP
jgi:hypothetical protein